LVPKAQKTANSTSFNFGRIAKPLRGGGGAPTSTSPGAGPAAGSFASGGAPISNSLARVQEDSGPGVRFFVVARMIKI